VDDLEQEIVTQIWQAVNRPRFDAEAGFWGFVELVTARRCIDWLRARRSVVPLSDALLDLRDDPLEMTLGDERTRIASGALEYLDSGCRELIHLRLKTGWSYQELSSRLGKSEGALRVQMHRCIQKAREAFERLAESEIER
jgi:RNA polymerase sigma factor (sigma-70 family)